MVYVLGWIAGYFCLGMWFLNQKHSKLLTAAMLLLLGTLAFLRNSGTDTGPIYEVIAGEFVHEKSFPSLGLEPGFSVLLWLFSLTTNSEVLIVRGFAVVFVGLLLTFLYFADSDESFFLLAFFQPVCFFQYSMNGLRIGLATGVLLLAWQALRRDRISMFIALSLLSFLFHYSSICIVLILLFNNLELKSMKAFVAMSVTVIAGLAGLYFNIDYFSDKFQLYSQFDSPSPYSGLSKTVPILAFVLLMTISGIKVMRLAQYSLVFASTAIMMQWLSMRTYAGLRILDIVLIGAALSATSLLSKSSTANRKTFVFGVVCIGLFSTAAVYRNFVMDYDGTETGTSTPFLPYRTFFQ